MAFFTLSTSGKVYLADDLGWSLCTLLAAIVVQRAAGKHPVQTPRRMSWIARLGGRRRGSSAIFVMHLCSLHLWHLLERDDVRVPLSHVGDISDQMRRRRRRDRRPPQWELSWKSIWSLICVLIVGNQYQTGSKKRSFNAILLINDDKS